MGVGLWESWRREGSKSAGGWGWLRGQAFQTKNHPSHLEIVSSKQFRWIAYLKTSKALRELLGHFMTSELYLFIPFLRTKSQISRTKTLSSKTSHKKDKMTNIIATNSFSGAYFHGSKSQLVTPAFYSQKRIHVANCKRTEEKCELTVEI